MILTSLCATASFDLTFDPVKNNVEILGPYIRYNFLNPPFSIGQNPIAKEDIGLSINSDSKGKTKIIAFWPKFLMDHGKVRIFNKKKKRIRMEKFHNLDLTAKDEHFWQLELSSNADRNQKDLKKGVQVCIEDILPKTKIKICSDWMQLQGQKFVASKPSNAFRVLFNGKKVPTNAQIEIPANANNINFVVKYRSGFTIKIKDTVHRVKLEEISLNIKEKTVGIKSDYKRARKAQLTWPQKLSKYSKEKNYYKDEFKNNVNWPVELEDVEMEFSPFEEGGGIQLYGLSFNTIPDKNFSLALDSNAPIATYSDSVVLRGFKATEEKVFGTSKDSLKVASTNDKFLWTFHATKKGSLNKDSLVYARLDGEKFYFSRKVFRGHQFSAALDFTFGSSLNLDFVPGYLFQAEYWPEKIFSRHPFLFQRWGLGISRLQTFSPITISRVDSDGQVTRGENWLVNYTRFDLMARFTRGVRPVQSSFGAIVRYNIPEFIRANDTLSPHLLGFGLFWHTAPVRLVDEFFNAVPFFRYPKWMELSIVYYPITFDSAFTSNFALSYDARGRIFFTPQWFMDASASVTIFSFTKEGDIDAAVATAQGTLGIGYQF